MSTTDLQTRFEAALRRELGMAGDGAAGGSVVTVRAPDVTVTPRIVAEMPSLPQPLEVLDVARNSNAFEYEMRVSRDAAGLIVAARLVPVARIEFGEHV